MPNLYTPEKKTIGNLLSNTSPPIEVPDWQRNYSWSTTEVETFWHDLIAFDTKYPAQNVNDQEYFLGSIVIVNTNVSHILLDGQQRIATSAVLISVIRDFFDRFNRDAGTRLGSKFLRDFDDGQNRDIDRLTLNIYDREFFRREVLLRRSDANYQTPVPQMESHHKIRAARAYLVTKFEEKYQELANPADAHAWALRISLVLTNHMSVVAVISEDEDNAAEVFETLNDRGIGLSTPDLLRNLLLRRAREQDRPSVVQMWGEILALGDDSDVKTFIRHFWLSREGDVKRQALYREIKTKIQAENIDSLAFTTLVRDAALTYRDLASAQDENEDVAKLLGDVRELDASSLYPSLLSGFSVYLDEAIRIRLLNALLALYVRYSVIGGKESARLETLVFTLAKDLRAGLTIDDAIARMREFAPSDNDFKATLASATVSRRGNARYLLKELELNRHYDPEFALQSPSKVHVEHVYPQNPQPGQRWANHDQAVNLLGNLTLLGKRLNNAARNGPIQQKQPFYRQSQITITRELGDVPNWTIQRIKDRQAAMAEQAAVIWILAP
jgi:uncharacterized protein with ParB-like and HNH nuclease domain